MKRAVVVVALLLTTACGSSDSPGSAPDRTTSGPTSSAAPIADDPAGAVESLMRALERGDCESAQDLVVTPSALGCELVDQAAGSFADEGIDLERTTYTAGPVEDTSTTVTIDWGNGDPHESYDVEQVDGRWLVVFDSAA